MLVKSSVKKTFSLIIFTIFFLTGSNVYAYTWGASRWVDAGPKQDIYAWVWYQDPIDSDGDPIPSYWGCDKWGEDGAFGSFGNGYWPESVSNVYANPSCTVSRVAWTPHLKEVVCSNNEVMIGGRFYEFTKEVDDEHQDAQCASISGLTFGASRWVSPANAYVTLASGYKNALCASDEVMTGVRMWGQWKYVDDEHIDARCTKVTGISSGGTYSWVSPPNALSTLWGGYKSASCPADNFMVGVRWYEFTDEIDDEHTDIYCYDPPAPSVNLWFSTFLKKLLSS